MIRRRSMGNSFAARNIYQINYHPYSTYIAKQLNHMLSVISAAGADLNRIILLFNKNLDVQCFFFFLNVSNFLWDSLNIILQDCFSQD